MKEIVIDMTYKKNILTDIDKNKLISEIVNNKRNIDFCLVRSIKYKDGTESLTLTMTDRNKK